VSGSGHDDIVQQLDAISERLGDISMGLIRDAIESGAPRPAEDKAADLLRRISDG
jgi:predicted DNA-binding protein